MIAATALLGACGGLGLGTAQHTAPTGDAFTKALYKECIALSKGDYEDSDVFAMRAMTAASGQPQAPEHVDARPQRKKAASALGAARKRLVNALIGGAASAKPAKPAMAARAQAMFECWTQEQEEDNQQDHIDRCRIQFFIALAQIEQKAVMKAPAKKKVMAKMSPVTFLVYFGFNSTTPDSSANSVIGTASEVIKDTKPKIVSITGHTDPTGSGSYNSALAEKRANVAADALRKHGVSGRLMTIGALGENANAVETKDSMKKSDTRRVEVSVRY